MNKENGVHPGIAVAAASNELIAAKRTHDPATQTAAMAKLLKALGETGGVEALKELQKPKELCYPSCHGRENFKLKK